MSGGEEGGFIVGVPLLELVGDDCVDFDGGNGIEKRQSDPEKSEIEFEMTTNYIFHLV